MGRAAYDTTGMHYCRCYHCANCDLGDQSINPSRYGQPTEVLLVTGRKKNEAFRSALSLLREEASLCEAKDLEKTHDEKENPQRDQPKET